jgi:hypothetical protein
LQFARDDFIDPTRSSIYTADVRVGKLQSYITPDVLRFAMGASTSVAEVHVHTLNFKWSVDCMDVLDILGIGQSHLVKCVKPCKSASKGKSPCDDGDEPDWGAALTTGSKRRRKAAQPRSSTTAAEAITDEQRVEHSLGMDRVAHSKHMSVDLTSDTCSLRL